MCNIFINFSKFFKSLWWVYFCWMSSETKFWRRHCSTGLEWNSYMKFCFMSPPSNQNPGAATGTTSTLCTAYYKKITLLNNLKLTVLLLTVNVHVTKIVSLAPRSLICISIGLQLHNVAQCTCVRVFSRTAQCCSSQNIRYSLISLH